MIFPKNFRSESRVVSIGDVHGRLEALRSAIESVKDPETAQLVLLGDYVHRGPDSRGVLDYLCRLEAEHPFKELIMLPGNHDVMLTEAVKDPRSAAAGDWAGNRCYMTIVNEYPGWDIEAGATDLAGSYPEQLRKRMSGELPLWHKNGDLLFIHAGVHPNMPDYANFPKKPYHPCLPLWVRYEFLGHEGGHMGPDGEPVFVIHGHTKLETHAVDELEKYALMGVDRDYVSLDTSHTDGFMMFDAEGESFSLNFVCPTASPEPVA